MAPEAGLRLFYVEPEFEEVPMVTITEEDIEEEIGFGKMVWLGSLSALCRSWQPFLSSLISVRGLFLDPDIMPHAWLVYLWIQ